jgi:pimeloyl-ACP methyl ester carboxylesterase
VRAGLATIEAGEGGRPLLLVHGFTGAKEDFAGQLEPLARAGWHVVAPDLPGHGETRLPGFAFGFEAYVEALLGLVDDLGWDRFAVLGHSMGGVVVQHLVLDHPERVTALVLMDTSPDAFGIDAQVVELACETALTQGMGSLLELQRAVGSPLDSDAGVALRADPAWAEAQDAKFLRCSPEMYVAMARLLTTAPSRADRLARVDVPTLVLVGEDDVLLRAPSDRLAAAIPGAELVVIPGAGHSPQVENPDAWFDAVGRFLG